MTDKNPTENDAVPTLVDYRANVEALFATGSSLIIENKDRDHAAILMSTLFNKAESEICVLSQKLEAQFYARPEVEKAILAAIEKGVTLKIVTQEEPETKKLAERLKNIGGEKVFFRIALPGSLESRLDFNFAVVDRKSFRFETDREACSAFASANNPELAKRILNSCVGIFDPQ